MATVNSRAAKSQLSRLARRCCGWRAGYDRQSGKTGGSPGAIAPKRKPRKLSTLAGKLHVPDDFDAPLPGNIIAEFEGR
jgi:hypothetical protein